MRYLSTRGAPAALAFDEVLLTGLARDGGLYLPESWPQLDLAALAGVDYPALAARVMQPFLGGRIAQADFARLVKEAYAGFGHRAVAPLRQIDSRVWLMEAAIEACRDRAPIDIFILHPEGRTSEVQRRQMTTVLSPNVRNVAIQGSFDDCQDLVKAMFADGHFRDEMHLAAVNSINWGRIMAQIVYYAAAALALGAPQRRVAFAVPTGNFGNAYAGYAARAMGLPIEKLIVGSNSNDILARFIAGGTMEMGEVHPTLSPSMDIQVSSNAERLLFDLFGRDGAKLTQAMKQFRESGRLALDGEQHRRLTALFAGHRLDDKETLATMAALYRETGELIDPHSAIGLAAARAVRLDPDVAVVALGTAHPAKFPDAVEKATGQRPALPPALADLYRRRERFTVLANDLAAVEAHIRDQVAAGRAA